MKTLRSITLCLGWLALVLLTMTSCREYTDDLQKLGSRVEVLEQKALEANRQYEALNEIIRAIETNGFVTRIVRNIDGTYTITFNNGKVITLRDGRQGSDGTDVLSVKQNSADGKWYWTVNGEWLLDGQGNMMRAGAEDGKDGLDASPATLPQVRINPTTREWEISTDGGTTWVTTGIPADGKDGKDGEDDIFKGVYVSPDGKSITFILRDGRSFQVPISAI